MLPRNDYMQQSFFHIDTLLFHHFFGCFVQYWFLDLQFYNQLSFWSASIVIGLHWKYQTRPKSMNKKINTNPHCFLSVIGPGGCGKTQLVSRILLNQKIIFKPCFETILYFTNISKLNTNRFYWDAHVKKFQSNFIKDFNGQQLTGVRLRS